MKGLNKVIAGTQKQHHAVGIDGSSRSDHSLTTNATQRLPEGLAAVVASHAEQGKYTHVVAANSVFSRDALIRAAALNGHQPISDVTSVESEDVFVRPIYAGNAVMTVKSSDDVKYLTVRASAFPAAEATDDPAPIVTYTENSSSGNSSSAEWVQEDLVKSDRPELGTAERVVSGGRGLKSKEAFDQVLLPLANSLRAAVGASRAAVDSGFADNSLQVGQTGNVVAPELYVAVGISGAIQHLAGMKDSKVIAAINKDPDAPIFQVADVGLVGDLFEAVPELTKSCGSA
ncbi:Putative electron transfer flavoprotein subunit alpha, mitochondrial [Fusarium odoratissimum]|uniref:Probable electron transfer flavoprotein subunit alpha n=2 Tax=Fusarium oxysporum species complex TaxID=171631 RepID=N1S6J3_FUSC4|nr:Putative electron transfer flavoprotein subunit alpha, mitochondrial [Fusarium odoratissimum]